MPSVFLLDAPVKPTEFHFWLRSYDRFDDAIDTAWFVNLKKYLHSQSQTQVVNFCTISNLQITNRFAKEEASERCHLLSHALQVLSLKLYSPLDYAAFMDGLLWSCHPQVLTVVVDKNNCTREFYKFLCDKLINGENEDCCCSSEAKCWVHSLVVKYVTHCRANPKFDFHRYMMRALEADFKKVVGISWYLWIFVVVFLLLNVHGWHAYFWIAFIPFILLLAVGTKLEHVIIQLAHEVAEKHVAIEGDLVVQPNDDHFWFHRPQIVLFLIHIILFQNSFEFAFFFWIWVQYGFDSCIMGEIGYIIPRLVIGAFVQFVCSYSTLPLYAIVTQMGSSFNKAIFEEHVQKGLLGWAARVKDKGMMRKAAAAGNGGSTAGRKEDSVSPPSVQLAKISKPTEIKPDSSVSGQRK